MTIPEAKKEAAKIERERAVRYIDQANDDWLHTLTLYVRDIQVRTLRGAAERITERMSPEVFTDDCCRFWLAEINTTLDTLARELESQ